MLTPSRILQAQIDTARRNNIVRATETYAQTKARIKAQKEFTVTVPPEYQKLSVEEIAAAEALLAARPATHPGTNVIINDSARISWLTDVSTTLQVLNITDEHAQERFLQIAGCPR